MVCSYFLLVSSRGKEPHQGSYYCHGIRRLVVSHVSPKSSFWLHFSCIQHLEHQDTHNYCKVYSFMEKSAYIFTHNIVFQLRNACLSLYCILSRTIHNTFQQGLVCIGPHLLSHPLCELFQQTLHTVYLNLYYMNRGNYVCSKLSDIIMRQELSVNTVVGLLSWCRHIFYFMLNNSFIQFYLHIHYIHTLFLYVIFSWILAISN